MRTHCLATKSMARQLIIASRVASGRRGHDVLSRMHLRRIAYQLPVCGFVNIPHELGRTDVLRKLLNSFNLAASFELLPGGLVDLLQERNSVQALRLGIFKDLR